MSHLRVAILMRDRIDLKSTHKHLHINQTMKIFEVKLTEFKREMHTSTVLFGDFNIS